MFCIFGTTGTVSYELRYVDATGPQIRNRSITLDWQNFYTDNNTLKQ